MRVIGRFAVSARYGPQVTVRAVRHAAPDTFDLSDLLDGPPRSAEQMELDLRELVGTVRNPWLTALLERVFEPFERAEHTARGTGLGLAIARGFATANGGSVTAEPGSSGGARFVLTLPASELPAPVAS